jgi:type VI secretion system protein ImpC
MTDQNPEMEAQAAAETTEASAATPGFLDEIIEATGESQRAQTTDLITKLVEKAMDGTVTWDRNIVHTLQQAIAQIDEQMSTQLAAVMHHPDFQKLEGSWRGFKYLVQNSETGTGLKIRVLNAGKNDIKKDLEKAVEFDQSQLFKKIYEHEYGMAGGEPYGALIGDFEFTQHPEDIEMLRNISGVCAASFCPFVAAAGPGMFGFQDYTELSKPRDLSKILDSTEHTKWKEFRKTEDSRFITLALPRVLSRLPYGENTKKIEEFQYEELPLGSDGKPLEAGHNEFTWMNASYVMGAKLTESFAKYGWCTSIRGAEGGGKVENLPLHTFVSDDGDMTPKCPTEIGITDRRDKELSDNGFLPLCHYKNTDYAVFFGGQTTQKPKVFNDPNATSNAALSAGLPYIMASSRIAHYLKVMARDKVGSKMQRHDVEDMLKNWLADYVCADEKPSQDMKSKYPLAEADVEVREVPGKPGVYDAIARLRPWLFFEELNASLRLVARLPQKG